MLLILLRQLLIGFISNHFLYDLANGKVKVIASEWPSFLYDQDLYNPEDKEIGFLKGYLLLRVRYFFLLPFLIDG